MSLYRDAIRHELEESARVKQAISDETLETIAQLAEGMISVFKQGGKAIFFGNGGSAADAQHLAAELCGRYEKERPSIPAFALTVNPSTLTALSNDYGYEEVFARQISGMVNKGDAAIGLTTSGQSINVIRALDDAHRIGAFTALLTGRDSGPAGEFADVVISVPSSSTPRIQEAHITIGHSLCLLVENALFPD